MGGKRKQQRQHREKYPRQSRVHSPTKTWMWLLIIVAVTLIAFAPAINNGFTNWDDSGYVTENYMIRDLSPAGFKRIFTSYVEGNFHPVTMLSLALDYKAHQLDPRGYHLNNALLHILNTLLVFTLILVLTDSLELSTITALFFGIHPLHVESVAWVSARKDVLYALFYLGSCISYVFYLRQEKLRLFYYTGALTLFVLSLLSKGMAVSLPVMLLLIDFYLKRRITVRSLAEKVPFVLLSVGFGVIAIIAQREKGAIQEITLFPFAARILFAIYGIAAYLIKSLVPVKLSAFYPYPTQGVTGLSPVFYLSPLVVAAVAFAVYKTLKHSRLIVFGALFFLVTVALVLQLFPVGSAIIADRYTYLPYVGVGLVIGYVFQRLMSSSLGRSKQIRTTIVVVFMTFGTALVWITRGRCEVWKDNLSLWTDVISKYPEVPVAYNNRALTYKEQGQYDLALADLESALRINPNDVDALCNRGNWYFLRGDHDKALVDLERALGVRAVPTGYNSRGAVHFNKGAFDKALADFNRAVELKPDYPEAYLNRANVLSVMQKYDKALADFDTYLAYDPNNAKAYYWRGLARYGLGNPQDAARDFGIALQISPQSGEVYQARARVFEALKKYGEALQDALRAKSLGQNVDPDYLERLKQSAH